MSKIVKKYRYVLGIDIGTSIRCTFCLFDNQTNEILYCSSINRNTSKHNVEHRKKIINCIQYIFDNYQIDIMLFETIRLFSSGSIYMQTILSLNKVQTTIINKFSENCDIYSIDVRSWKAKVLGNGNATKEDTVRTILHKYPNIELLEETVRPIKKEIELSLNEDLADAICISQTLHYDTTILKDKNKMNFK